MKKSWHQNFTRKPKELRTSPDGILHASTEEMHRWCKLQMDEKLGLIRNLKRQVAFPLQIDEFRAVRTPTGKVAKYTADFTYERQGLIDIDITSKDDSRQHVIKQPGWIEVIEDHKGFMDKVGELRMAVFEGIYGKKIYIHKR